MPHTDYLWRVEFPDGDGPYRERPDGTFVTDLAPFGTYVGESSPRHPTPPDDGLGHTAPPWPFLFAFDTLDQADDWFYEPRDGDYFAEQGLTLTAYPQEPVSNIKFGRKQVVFNPTGLNPIRFDIRCLWSEREGTLSRRADEQRARTPD